MVKKKLKKVVQKRRSPREHHREGYTVKKGKNAGKQVKSTTVNKGIHYPKKTKPIKQQPKPKPKTQKKQIKKTPESESKEAVNELLHQQIMQNNKELNETVKKLYMVKEDEDRLYEKLLKIEEEIIDTQDYMKKLSTLEGKKAFYKSRVGQKIYASDNKPATVKEVEEMRKRSIEAARKDLEAYNKKAFPLREKILERKKQINTLQGQRNGLKAHLAYLQSYKASVKIEKDEWVSKAQGARYEVEDIQLF